MTRAEFFDSNKFDVVPRSVEATILDAWVECGRPPYLEVFAHMLLEKMERKPILCPHCNKEIEGCFVDENGEAIVDEDNSKILEVNGYENILCNSCYERALKTTTSNT